MTFQPIIEARVCAKNDYAATCSKNQSLIHQKVWKSDESDRDQFASFRLSAAKWGRKIVEG